MSGLFRPGMHVYSLYTLLMEILLTSVMIRRLWHAQGSIHDRSGLLIAVGNFVYTFQKVYTANRVPFLNKYSKLVRMKNRRVLSLPSRPRRPGYAKK